MKKKENDLGQYESYKRKGIAMLTIRMPQSLLRRIDIEAAKIGCSRNRFINWLLEQRFDVVTNDPFKSFKSVLKREILEELTKSR